MLYLTEISIPIQSAIEATMSVDPLVASDLDYCIKTWMADKPSLACRPWRAAILRDAVRITGWRDEPASYSEKSVYLRDPRSVVAGWPNPCPFRAVHCLAAHEEPVSRRCGRTGGPGGRLRRMAARAVG